MRWLLCWVVVSRRTAAYPKSPAKKQLSIAKGLGEKVQRLAMWIEIKHSSITKDCDSRVLEATRGFEA